MGFAPMMIDVKDLVRAVETHEVDAQENPLTHTVNFGLHRTHKHLSLTAHFRGVALLLANRAWFEALPPRCSRPCWRRLPTRRRRSGNGRSRRTACALSGSGEGVAMVPAEEIDLAAFRAAVRELGEQVGVATPTHGIPRQSPLWVVSQFELRSRTLTRPKMKPPTALAMT